MGREQSQLDVRQLGVPADGLYTPASSAGRALHDLGGLHVPLRRGAHALCHLPDPPQGLLQSRDGHHRGAGDHRLLLLLRRSVRRKPVRVVRLGACRGVVCGDFLHQLPLTALLETRQESGIRADRAERLRADGEVGEDFVGHIHCSIVH